VGNRLYLTLDDLDTRLQAGSDPESVVARAPRLALDEVTERGGRSTAGSDKRHSGRVGVCLPTITIRRHADRRTVTRKAGLVKPAGMLPSGARHV
jgi:hypothetical protein